ncbi:MAG: beta-ketoacyl synthase chain length factor [Pseudomonadales bacterium]
MTVKFAVSEWSGWTPLQPSHASSDTTSISYDQAPDVSAIPAMLRRRLNSLGRACASQVLTLLPPTPDIPLVYCSQHGDIERTLAVLLELAESATVSPNNFSLAVHNAICGVLSIHAGLTGSINTIAAGQQGLVPVLLEAAGLLSPSCPQVLCVLCDVRLPEVYQTANAQPHAPYAVCFVVSTVGGVALDLRQRETAAINAGYVPPLDFCAFLDNQAVWSVTLAHNCCSWEIAKC